MAQSNRISIDYGTRKSGLAYSVEGFCFAHKTVDTRDLLEYLKRWIKEKNASEIIVGLPLNIDGTESKHSKRVRIFAKELESIFGGSGISQKQEVRGRKIFSKWASWSGSDWEINFSHEEIHSFREIPIILHDERLTTAEARMSDVDDIDAESARLILMDYLEHSER